MIYTERLYFRALEKEDLSLRAKWLNNPTVRETLFFRYPVSLAETELWYSRVIMDITRKDFIICLRENNNPIGFAGYVNIDLIHSKAEPFIAIGEVDAWGKGYGTEIVHALLNFGLNELGLNRMYGFILENNAGALKMDLRAGFIEEGLLKEDVLIHGSFHDRIMVGVTRKQFNDRFKTNSND